jgi:hypothetical protein
MSLTQIQRDTLLRPIRPARVKQTQGNSYLEAWDVIAYLTKVFGFEGWDKEVVHLGPIFETPGKSKDGSRDVWTVAYRCDMRLVIRDPEGNVIKVTDDVGTGEAINQPSRGDAHDLAAKSAVSSALKRCAKDLGDQFGLGLYDGGSTAACLGRVVIYEGVRASGDDGATVSEPPASRDDGHTFGGEGDSASGVVVHASSQESPPVGSDLKERAANLGKMSEPQRRKIYAILNDLDIPSDKAATVATEVLGRPVEHLSDLTIADAKHVIDHLVARQDKAKAS